MAITSTTPHIVVATYVLTSVVFLLVFIRVSLRHLKRECFTPDDYVMVGSMALYIINTVVATIILSNGTNLSISDPKHMSYAELQRAIYGSKWVLVSRCGYLTYIWCMKTCMLIFYFRLIQEVENLIALIMTAGLVGISYICCILVVFLECRPLYLQWQVFPSTPDCAIGVNGVMAMASTNIATDIILMALPVPLIFRKHRNLTRALQFTCLYLISILVVYASVMRLLIVFSVRQKQHRALWSQLECFFATVVVNAPIIQNVWRNEYWGHIHHTVFGSIHWVGPRNHRRDLENGENTTGAEELAPNARQYSKGRLSVAWSIVSGRVRSSLGSGIRTQITLVQTRKTEEMGPLHDDGEPPLPMETFMGDGIILGEDQGKKHLMAKVRSYATSEKHHPPKQRHRNHGRRWGFTRRKTDSDNTDSEPRGKYTGDEREAWKKPGE